MGRGAYRWMRAPPLYVWVMNTMRHVRVMGRTVADGAGALWLLVGPSPAWRCSV